MLRYILIFFLTGIISYTVANEGIAAIKTEADSAEVKEVIAKIEAARKESLDSAQQMAQQLLRHCQELNVEACMADAYKQLGDIAWYKSEFSEAFDAYLNELELRKKSGDKKKEAACLGNIALLNFNNGNFKNAEAYFLKTLEVFKEFDDQRNIALTYTNLGNVAFEQKNYSGANDYYAKSYKIATKGLYHNISLYNLINQASIYELDSAYSKAIERLNLGLEVAKKVNSHENTYTIYRNLGMLFNKMNDYENAVFHLEKARKLVSSQYSKDNIELLHSLSSAYYELSNYKRAASISDSVITFLDTVYNKNKIQTLNELQTKFETQQKEQEIQLLKKDKEISEKKKRIYLGGVVMAVVVILLVLNQFRISRKTNKKLLEKNKTIEKKNEEIGKQHLQITDSIGYAKKIQRAILPPEKIFKNCFSDSFVFYKPKDIVSGDFYWFHQEGDDVIFSVADCTGHGVPGAFMSIIGNNMLDKAVIEEKLTRPDAIMNRLNVLLYERLRKGDDETEKVKDGMDLVICHIDLKTKQLQVSGVHNPMYIVRNKELSQIKGDRMHLGNIEQTKDKPYQLKEEQLMQGDRLYLFSDGFADQKGGKKGKKFYYPPFRKLLAENSHLPMDEQKQILFDTFNEWKGERNQIDDVCILGIKI